MNRANIARTDASGKGVNVARVLSQLGAHAVHLTHAGGPNRDWFLSLCAADGLSVEWADSGSEVRICTTVIDSQARPTLGARYVPDDVHAVVTEPRPRGSGS